MDYPLLDKVKEFGVYGGCFFINATPLKKYINQIRVFLRDNTAYDLFGVVEMRLSRSVVDDIIRVEVFSKSAGKTETCREELLSLLKKVFYVRYYAQQY